LPPNKHAFTAKAVWADFDPATYCLNISAALGMVSSQERSYKLAEWILVSWLIFFGYGKLAWYQSRGKL
jgi:hypothetical protein